MLKKDYNYWFMWKTSVELIDDFENGVKKNNLVLDNKDYLKAVVRAYRFIMERQAEEISDLRSWSAKLKVLFDNHLKLV